MVMLAEVMESPASLRREADRAAVRSRIEGLGSSNPRSGPSGLDVQVSKLLSQNAREFNAHQWQPFGE